MSEYEIDVPGTKRWLQNGKKHREDGPALEYYFGEKQWWVNGNKYTEDDFLMLQFTNRKIVCPTQ